MKLKRIGDYIMDLNNLIPDKSDKWVIDKNILFYKKYKKIPICYISEDDTIYVFINKLISKTLIKFINNLIKLDIKFFLTKVEMSNPMGIYDYHNEIIKNYLYISVQEEFFGKFIGFDIIENMIKWCNEEKCIYLIKDNYDYFFDKVNNSYYYLRKPMYNSSSKMYDYSEEIRDYYNSLWRDIQMDIILN